jgi:hypothetical protein
MRKIITAVTAALILIGGVVSAQDSQKATKDSPKAKSGHETMAKGTSGPSGAAAIARATSAAPPEIGKGAAVMGPGPDGKMTQLRAGTNGWVCMLDPQGDPMCLDKEWQAWGDAWMNKKDPPQPKTVGIAYMLKGDKGASNTDPYAAKPTADNQWVVSGPHIMVLPTDPAQFDAFPTDPKAGGPWVMWKGTKYVNLMVPTAPMPKTPTPAKGAAKSSTDK